MSYVVFARKWRPMRFEEVVGQEHVTTTLANAIRAGRLANAYLFAGPRGVGKTTVARILAKAVNCDQGPTPEPCNTCTSCVEITEGRSLDVLEIDGASNRGVDEVRNLRENILYAGSPGKHKIYIIDEVHMLTTEAFNALLKTLEEPPANVMFIFATTEPHKVPATILSRCQRFNFHRLPISLIVQQLDKICKAEGIEADPEALRIIAEKADGSMRDAESLLDQTVSFSGGNVSVEAVSSLVGVVDRTLYFRLGDAIARSDVAEALAVASEVHTQGYDFNEFLQGVADYFRDLLVVRAGADSALLNVSEDVLKRYEEQARAFTEEDLLRLTRVASDAAYRLKFSPNPRMRFEMALVRLAKLLKSAELEELFRQVGAVAAGDGGARKPTTGSRAAAPRMATAATRPAPRREPPPPPQPPPGFATRPKTVSSEPPSATETSPPAPEPGGQTTQPPVGDLTLEAVRERWPEIVAAVRKKRMALGVFLAEG
ncbi:MAG: DNA polymerase III subunit gamma/tau, partial [Calditrichaeota bacterium]|nr:DNA polymerase III subunit gamma/tau [Calditrichota bacterium]